MRARLFILPLLILLATISCKKEEPVANYFTYELIKYEVDEAILEYYGKLEPDVTGYNFDVTIFSSGITYDPSTRQLHGKGNIIVMEMFSESSEELVPGTYTFDSGQSMDKFTFDEGTFGLFVDMDEQTGTAVFVNSGRVDISRKGSTYKFVFDCKTVSGNPITGSFSGELDLVYPVK